MDQLINCAIIDDEKEARDRLEAMLNLLENVNLVHKTGIIQNCTETIKKINPDVIFIDIEMPGRSGFDVINDLRENGCKSKFIFVTGYNQYALKAIKAEAFDYILKPIDLDELRSSVERFSQKRFDNLHIAEDFFKKHNFTQRETEIYRFVKQGKTSRQIAEILCISKHTVDTHRRNILDKINN